jgi:hypothetical protein
MKDFPPVAEFSPELRGKDSREVEEGHRKLGSLLFVKSKRISADLRLSFFSDQ